jgi:AcrR family transcriptional regulator
MTHAPATGNHRQQRQPARARRRYAPRMPAEARRDQLLDAALEIIARDGYGAVSIEAIARRVDVTRPVIYNVFDGLDELLATLLDRQERRALTQLAIAIGAEPNLRDVPGFVEQIIRDFAQMLSADPLTWRLILRAFDGTPAAVRARVDRDRELVRQQIRSTVEQLLSAQRTSDLIDPDVIAHLVIATGEYLGRMVLAQPGAVDPDRIASTVRALFAGLDAR